VTARQHGQAHQTFKTASNSALMRHRFLWLWRQRHGPGAKDCGHALAFNAQMTSLLYLDLHNRPSNLSNLPGDLEFGDGDLRSNARKSLDAAHSRPRLCDGAARLRAMSRNRRGHGVRRSCQQLASRARFAPCQEGARAGGWGTARGGQRKRQEPSRRHRREGKDGPSPISLAGSRSASRRQGRSGRELGQGWRRSS